MPKDTSHWLRPSNKTPDQYTYAELSQVLTERDATELKAGHNTRLLRANDESIHVVYYSTIVAVLNADGSVLLNGGEPRTTTNADRMTRCVAPLGFTVMLAPARSFYWLIKGPRKNSPRWTGRKFDSAILVQPPTPLTTKEGEND